MNPVYRYPHGTPDWIVRRDYWMQCARDALARGKKLKARRLMKKARAEFLKAGGFEGYS